MKMSKGIAAALLLCCLFQLTACSNAKKSEYQTISAKEAKGKIDQGNVTIVDVRTAEEYEESHIPGAILVPNESIDKKPPQELPDQNAVLLVYCRSGRRSSEAAGKLAKLGYRQVYDFGGIINWPYEVEPGLPE